MNAPRTELATALVAFLAAMALVWLIGPREFVTGDTTHYLAMVDGDAAPAPFGYRPLMPVIVAALPVSPAAGFFLVAYLSTLGTLLGLRALLRHLGVSHQIATASGVFLCLSYPVAGYLARWGRIDALANCLFVLALLLIVRRRPLAAAATMAVGVLAKETLIFLVPILFLHQIRHRLRDPRAWAGAVLLCLLPIASLVAARSTIEVAEGQYAVESPDDLDLAWQRIWEYNVEEVGLPKRVARDLTKSYGFFWALAALGLLAGKTVPRRGTNETTLELESLYLIGIGFALCVVATDWARMLGTGYPGIFIPAALLLDRVHAAPHRRRLIASFTILAAAQCYLSLLVFRELERPDRIAMMAAQAMVVVVGAGLALWAYHAGRRSAALEQLPGALVDSR